MGKQKYYVVWIGHKTGIFTSWSECSKQVKGFEGAKYKSFPSKAAADTAFANDYKDSIKQGAKGKGKSKANRLIQTEVEWNSLSVDAACSGNPGAMEYRGVWTATNEEVFRIGPFRYGTNNVGEFLALVHGLALLQKMGKPDFPIYSDSRIAMGWVEKKVFRSKLERTRVNQKLFVLVDRALVWLKKNSYNNPVLKWETKEWGEIPADFGRK